MFKFSVDTPFTDLGGGVSRRVLAYNDDIMTVEVRFKKGAVGAIHTHPHAQISYVVKGKFEAKIGDECRVITVGDSYATLRDEPHGVICLEDGILIDVFTPKRDDFLR